MYEEVDNSAPSVPQTSALADEQRQLLCWPQRMSMGCTLTVLFACAHARVADPTTLHFSRAHVRQRNLRVAIINLILALSALRSGCHWNSFRLKHVESYSWKEISEHGISFPLSGFYYCVGSSHILFKLDRIVRAPLYKSATYRARHTLKLS